MEVIKNFKREQKVLVQEILDKLDGVKKTGDQKWQALCPVHGDEKQSLSISVGDNGKPLLYCHAGCSYKDIVKTLGIDTNHKKAIKRAIVATYDYLNESGTLVHQTVRYSPKKFLQRRPDGKSSWIWDLKGITPILYHLPELLAANKKEWIFVVEGEKDANRLAKLGLIATTCPMGAGKWRSGYNEYLRDRRVVILPDNDKAGLEHAINVAESLLDIAAEIKILELPELLKKDDVSDWLDNGGTKEKLLQLAEEAKIYVSSPITQTENESKSFNLTDVGNAERLAQKYGDKIRYCWTTGKLVAFDGKRWNFDIGIVETNRYAIETARDILIEANQQSDSVMRKKFATWAFQSEKASSLKSMITIAKSLLPITAYAKDFDKDDYSLNVLNGTVDLRTGRLRPHKPDDMITKLAPVSYPIEQRQASIKLWLNCLNTWHRDDKDAIDYLQRLAGMCLTGDTSSRCFPIFYGGGKNGKSVFLDTIMMLMGDYATTAPRTLLKISQNEEHATEIACLLGKRLVIASETKKTMKLKTALVKAMTGDAMIKARFMRQDYFDFQPTHKIILVTQNLPVIDEASDAIWDRVHKMEWSVRIPDDKQNTHLLEDLKKEWSGILKWLVDGCLKWQKDGTLIPTESIRKQTEEYRNDMNPIKAFIDDECIIGSELFVAVTELRQLYDTWANINGYDEKLSTREFSDLMRESGYKKSSNRVNGKVVKCWQGISLANDTVDEDDIPI